MSEGSGSVDKRCSRENRLVEIYIDGRFDFLDRKMDDDEECVREIRGIGYKVATKKKSGEGDALYISISM